MAPTTTTDTERIGANVRRIREEKGLRVGELADKAGVTRWTVTNVETGRVTPTGATLGKLALGLGVPLDQIKGEGRAA